MSTDRRPRARDIDALFAARRDGAVLAPMPSPATEADGYRMQFALHDRLTAEGWGRRVGWKVGATTKVMRDLLAIDHPCAGGIMAERVHQGGARLASNGFRRAGIECEIAARLASDVPIGEDHDIDGVSAHVGAVMAAMEIVDDRNADFRQTPAATLIADDFFQSAAVLGPETADWRGLDLAAMTGITRIDGVEAGRGRGAEVMGHPLAALAWLANRLGTFGIGLTAGEFVLLGSLVAVQWLDGPARAMAEIRGLGSVEAAFD